MSTAIIIPVKHLIYAKQRLAGLLTQQQRADLVLAMLKDLLTTVSQVDCGDVYVVTGDSMVIDLARQFPTTIIREEYSKGYNNAVALGIENVPEGYNIAVVPADVPAASILELNELVAPAVPNKPTVRLAGARDVRGVNGQGTNGLFLSSGALLKPNFGPNSFTGYQCASRSGGITPKILNAPLLAHDIDTPNDVFDLIEIEMDTATHHCLAQFGDLFAPSLFARGTAA